MSGKSDKSAPPASGHTRLWQVDVARTGAILAMVLYHFVYDLGLFGLVPAGTAFLPGWRWLAYLTASSFLFLAGVSLWLAHGRGIRWRGFTRRFLRVAGAALLVTVATYFAIGPGFIFFGILHAIAAASLIGLLLLRVPALVLLALGALVLALPNVARFELLSAPYFWWLGLQTVPVRAVDFVPLFPWAALLIWGIAAAKLAEQAGIWAKWAARPAPTWAGLVSWPGRYSLWVYLAHQPILIALLWLALTVL